MLNYMNQLKAITWKETLEAYRTTRVYILISIIMVIIMQILPIKNILESNIPMQSKVDFISNTTIYLAPIIIPYCGSTVLYRSLIEERKQKSIDVIFSIGITPEILWFGKFVTASFFSYITFIITYIIYILFIRIYWSISIVMSAKVIVSSLIVTPLISLSILCIMAFAYWVFKNAQIITMFIPMLTSLTSWNIVMKYNHVLPSYTLISIGLLIPILIISIIFYCIRFISKERITDM